MENWQDSQRRWYQPFIHSRISEINTFSPVKLHDMALFTVAQNFWRTHIDFNDRFVNFNWIEREETVPLLLPEYFKDLPVSILDKITNSVEFIGNELSSLFMYKFLNCLFLYCLMRIRVDDIYWTTSFTIDRAKTFLKHSVCTSHIYNYRDPVPMWTLVLWAKDGLFYDNIHLERYFRADKFFVFFHWICNMEYFVHADPLVVASHFVDEQRIEYFMRHYMPPISFISHHLLIFEPLYKMGCFEENIFIFMVITGNLNSLPYLLSKIDHEKQQRNIILSAEIIVTKYSPERFKKYAHVAVRTFEFLWENLENRGRNEFVENHLPCLCKFIIKYAGTENLVHIINLYPVEAEKYNILRQVLHEVTVILPPECRRNQKHWKIFLILYRKAASRLDIADVINLLEKVLREKNIETAVKLVKFFGGNKKELIDKINSVWISIWRGLFNEEIFLPFISKAQSFVSESTVENNNKCIYDLEERKDTPEDRIIFFFKVMT